MKKKDAIEQMYEDGCKLGDLSEDFYVFFSIKYSIFIYQHFIHKESKRTTFL